MATVEHIKDPASNPRLQRSVTSSRCIDLGRIDMGRAWYKNAGVSRFSGGLELLCATIASSALARIWPEVIVIVLHFWPQFFKRQAGLLAF